MGNEISSLEQLFGILPKSTAHANENKWIC